MGLFFKAVGNFIFVLRVLFQRFRPFKNRSSFIQRAMFQYKGYNTFTYFYSYLGTSNITHRGSISTFMHICPKMHVTYHTSVLYVCLNIYILTG